MHNDLETRAREVLAAVGRFPSGGDVPYNAAVRAIVAALTPPPVPADIAGLVERAQEWIRAQPKVERAEPLVRELATALVTLAGEKDRLYGLCKANNALARMNGTRATAAEAEAGLLREAIPGIWRSGVSDAISAVDAVRPRRNMKGKALQDAAADLDRNLQRIHDERMKHAPTTYSEAADAGKAIRAALAPVPMGGEVERG